MLQLAQASWQEWHDYYDNNNDGNDNDNHKTTVKDDDHHHLGLFTTRCDASHCFAPLKKSPRGALHPYLTICGAWLPHDIRGRWRVVCSTVRLLYLTAAVWWMWNNRRRPQYGPDVIVLDVLPTPLPLLQWLFPDAALLFYCHFPDQLLIQTTTAATTTKDPAAVDNNNNHHKPKSWYRRLVDSLENVTLPFADLIVVNSQFTRRTVLQTFSSLQRQEQQEQEPPQSEPPPFLPVLYPALDTAALDVNVTLDDIAASLPAPLYRLMMAQTTKTTKTTTTSHSSNNTTTTTITSTVRPIVSLNRFERKKNIALLLRAVAWLYDNHNTKHWEIPPVLIAGGYDPANHENVQHLQELRDLARRLLPPDICNDKLFFLPSISDAQRTYWLQQATAVVYTPSHEHFGIVPLEAMYCQTPVICAANGGPLESVVDGVTGYLCRVENDNQDDDDDDTATAAASFGRALQRVLTLSETDYRTMGCAARRHVTETFGQDRLQRQWRDLLREARAAGTERRRRRKQQQQEAWRLWLVVVVVVMMMVWWWWGKNPQLSTGEL